MDLRLFGESKAPNKLHWARDDVEDYLKRDMDFHAVALLSDGIEWELWIRPMNEHPSLYQVADLRNTLREVQSRNLEKEAYQPYAVRGTIDEVFGGFKDAAVKDIICSEFGLTWPIG
jgi:hypothetical protein